MDSTLLWLSLLFGSVGMGLFIYGKKQLSIPHLIAGVALMVCPYVVSNPIALGIVGVVLTIVPFVIP